MVPLPAIQVVVWLDVWMDGGLAWLGLEDGCKDGEPIRKISTSFLGQSLRGSKFNEFAFIQFELL